MSTTIPKTLPPGKDPPDKVTKSPTPSLKTPKSPQPASSTPDQPSETVRPPFTPFFVLCSDPCNSSIHHPTQVHYLFSDDDPEILTTACLSTLSTSPTTSIPSPAAPSSSSSSSSAIPRRKTHHVTTNSKERIPPQRSERTIILTLSETGDTVISAHSLTPTWQILSTEITNAPTWDAAEAEGKGTSHAGGLMLRIEGTDGNSIDDTLNWPVAAKSSESQQKRIEAVGEAGVDMQALMESFDAKMSMLRKIIEAGGEGLSGQVKVEGLQEAAAEEA